MIASWCSAWRPTDTRPVGVWAAENVVIPNSARASRFDPSASPWLAEPLEYFSDTAVKEQVLILPTGAGKTTVFDVAIPYLISEAPGSVLLSMQTDSDAREHMEDRLLPILRGCEPLAEVMRSVDRHAMRKDAVIMPHMSLFCGGANKANFQRKSVRYVFLDEAWLIKHGLIEEARARTHSRWNSRIIVVSQGGEMHVNLANERRDSELYAAWQRTDRRELHMVCPECAAESVWSFKHLKYERTNRDDGTVDEQALMESAEYQCPACEVRFPDKPDIRRALSTASIYRPTNPTPLPHHHGWHAPAVALFHERWGDLALAWTRAQKARSLGDEEPLKIFVTKRLADFWREEEVAMDVTVGGAGYLLSEYTDGQTWDGEVTRCITVDRQRDHRWAICRAWRRTGESRLLWEGRLLTSEDVENLRIRMKVLPPCVMQDAQYETAQVYDECVKYGWNALHGSGQDGFTHFVRNMPAVKKFFSPVQEALAPCGAQARYMFWSAEKVKDVLAILRSGKGVAWETPDDASPDYRLQIASEVKKDMVDKVTKRVTRRWQKVRKDNHLWDCEAMAVVFALKARVIGSTVPTSS
jgi:hypothetical protein